MKKIILSFLSVIAVAIYAAMPQLPEENVGQDNNTTSNIEDSVSNSSDIEVNPDTLIKHNYVWSLRNPYDASHIDSLIAQVKEVPESKRSEYYSQVQYYFEPLITNFGKYTMEVDTVIGRFQEMIALISKYDKDKKTGAKTPLGKMISGFDTKGKLHTAKAKGLKEIPFTYFVYYKDDYQTIPYLNMCIDKVLVVMRDYEKSLSDPDKNPNIDKYSVAALNEIRNSLRADHSTDNDLTVIEPTSEDADDEISDHSTTQDNAEEEVVSESKPDAVFDDYLNKILDKYAEWCQKEQSIDSLQNLKKKKESKEAKKELKEIEGDLFKELGNWVSYVQTSCDGKIDEINTSLIKEVIPDKSELFKGKLKELYHVSKQYAITHSQFEMLKTRVTDNQLILKQKQLQEDRNNILEILRDVDECFP